MAKVGPNAINFAIAEMTGQLLTLTTHPNFYIWTTSRTCFFYKGFSLQVSSEEFVEAVLGQEQFSKMLTLEIMNIFIDGSK